MEQTVGDRSNPPRSRSGPRSLGVPLWRSHWRRWSHRRDPGAPGLGVRRRVTTPAPHPIRTRMQGRPMEQTVDDEDELTWTVQGTAEMGRRGEFLELLARRIT